MNYFKYLLVFALGFLFSFRLSSAEAIAEVATSARLNNQAVLAMKDQKWQHAIKVLSKALRLDPTNSLVRENLIIAHNSLGLAHRNNPKKALKSFRAAAFLGKPRYPQVLNKSAFENIDDTLRSMGKDPSDFTLRVKLAEEAASGGDYADAIVEYSAALKLKDDPMAHEGLAKAYSKLNPADRAASEYGTQGGTTLLNNSGSQ